MNWLRNLQFRWKVRSVFQVLIILIVFALTGTTVAYLMKPVLRFFFGESVPIWARILYVIFILPVYNIFLLLYGFLFGQFYFFWNLKSDSLEE